MNNEIVTFGCRLNSYESELIKEALTKAKGVNTIVFNTCAVTKEAQRQAKQAIRKSKRLYPEKKIIVTGCAAQLNPAKFSLMPEVDSVIGNQEKLSVAAYLQNEAILVDDIMQVKEAARHLVTSFENKSRAFIQIQNGCNHRCTFCIIPYARGNNRSVPIGVIVKQAHQLLAAGFCEIVLTGVDISDYGLDLPGKPSLAQMLKRLLMLVPKLKRLRLSSIDVAEIDSELFSLLAYEQKIMPHIHISLQAGDDMILKRMKRRHNRQQVIDFCQTLRKARPTVAFGADIIAGFPTENELMFSNTLSLIHEASIQYLHVFPYSKQENTPASRMPQVDKKISKNRAKLLRRAGEVELTKFLAQQVNKELAVITEKNNIARADNFAMVELEQNHPASRLHIAKINKASGGRLFGSIVD